VTAELDSEELAEAACAADSNLSTVGKRWVAAFLEKNSLSSWGPEGPTIEEEKKCIEKKKKVVMTSFKTVVSL